MDVVQFLSLSLSLREMKSDLRLRKGVSFANPIINALLSNRHRVLCQFEKKRVGTCVNHQSSCMRVIYSRREARTDLCDFLLQNTTDFL